MGFGTVRALQRSVGNAAVSQVVGRPRNVVQRALIEPTGNVKYPTVKLDEADKKKSREAILYIKGSDVYKMYTKEATANAVLSEMAKAAGHGVPVPPWKSYKANYTDDNNGSKQVTVIHSRRVEGTFFQLSKHGGAKTFINAVNGMSDVTRMRRIRHQLAAAKDAGISDPQGMISNDPQEGVMFFLDIHTGGTASGIDDLIRAVDERIKAFTP
ncbi:hypothetical protein [Streptomyces sp. AC627_RSS907]|uniref:hypothetical protein n=1 Tax=Streptomyces sp. AC627_RSS907 TaxID=2823684 RepID=UPI001C23B41C|nr:hypothetical protein [Streptomyces sp. AC627_RSS907]